VNQVLTVVDKENLYTIGLNCLSYFSCQWITALFYKFGWLFGCFSGGFLDFAFIFPFRELFPVVLSIIFGLYIPLAIVLCLEVYVIAT